MKTIDRPDVIMASGLMRTALDPVWPQIPNRSITDAAIVLCATAPHFSGDCEAFVARVKEVWAELYPVVH